PAETGRRGRESEIRNSAPPRGYHTPRGGGTNRRSTERFREAVHDLVTRDHARRPGLNLTLPSPGLLKSEAEDLFFRWTLQALKKRLRERCARIHVEAKCLSTKLFQGHDAASHAILPHPPAPNDIEFTGPRSGSGATKG